MGDSMEDDTAYGRGTAHDGEHCCVEKVKQCKPKYGLVCNLQNAEDLTYAQCKKVAKNVLSAVDKKAQFPGCYYRKADGEIFWNSFEAEAGHGKAYARICRVRQCKNSKTTTTTTTVCTYSVGEYTSKTRLGMETRPTCPDGAAPVTSAASCEDSARILGKDFRGETNLTNYPRGCSDRRMHDRFEGFWWNNATVGDWDQHPGFKGEVALVCCTSHEVDEPKYK